MADEELIDQYIDRPAVSDDTKFLIGELKSVLDLIEKINATKITLGGAKGVNGVSEAAKEAQKAVENLEIGKKKLIETDLAAQKAAIAEKEAIRQRNAELKNQVREEQAAEGSIEKLRAALIRLRKEYDNLSNAERDAGKGQELLVAIQNTDTELKKLEGTTGRFQRNVGNYANAFAEALTPIQGQLQKIQAQIKSGGFGDKEIQKLQQQESLLLNVQKQLTQEFGSTRQQSRAFQEAVQQIGIEFGHQSQVFQEFKDQVGEGVDSLNDIRDSIKLAASDTRQLDQFIGAATAIAGGFSIAQGAAALFGKESEDVQKALLKVQAVMGILNGLQAIQNELKNKDSLLRKLTGFLIKDETKAIQSQTIAQTANAAATTSAASATNAAAVATNRFGTALKAIGIGILLTLIPLVATAMNSLSKAAVKVDKDLEGMGETALEIADSSIKQLDDQIKNLNDSLGRTPTAIQKAQKTLELLNKELKNLETVNETNDFKAAYDDIVNTITEGESKVQTILKKRSEIRAKIAQLEFLQRLKAADEYLQAEFEANKNAIQNRADLDKDANERALNKLKKDFDDKKIVESKFLSDGKKILEANLKDELAIINANAAVQLSQAKGSKGKINEIEDNANTARIIAERNFNDKLIALTEEAEKRRRKIVSTTIQGIVEITGSGLSKMAQALDSITQDNMPVAIKQLILWREEFEKSRDTIIDGLKSVQQEFQSSLFGAFDSFVSSIFDGQTSHIREQIETLEEKKNKEIEVAESTIQNEKDRQDAIYVIEKKAQADREILEKRARALEVERAKFDKAFAIMQIAIDTAQKVAAIKAQIALLTAASTTNPFLVPLIPVAAAQIPFVIATGAIAAAAVAARQIPKLKKGRQKGPATLAITGDGGIPEVVASPDLKEHYVTPSTDTLTYLQKDWKVFPDVVSFNSAALKMNMKPLPAMPVVSMEGSNNNAGVITEIRELKQVIKNKPVTHITGNHAGVTAIIQYGNDFIEYVDKSVNF